MHQSVRHVDGPFPIAAQRGHIRTVLIPEENEKDLAEIPASVLDTLEIVPVRHVDEVLERALTRPLSPIEWTEADELATMPAPAAAPEADSALRH